MSGGRGFSFQHCKEKKKEWGEVGGKEEGRRGVSEEERNKEGIEAERKGTGRGRKRGRGGEGRKGGRRKSRQALGAAPYSLKDALSPHFSNE